MGIFAFGTPMKWPSPTVVGWCRSFSLELLHLAGVQNQTMSFWHPASVSVSVITAATRQSDTLCSVRVTLWQEPFSPVHKRLDRLSWSNVTHVTAQIYLLLLISSFSGGRKLNSQLNRDTPAQLHSCHMKLSLLQLLNAFLYFFSFFFVLFWLCEQLVLWELTRTSHVPTWGNISSSPEKKNS